MTQEKLLDLLKRLNAGENLDVVKQEAKELLSSLNPQDLALEEQKLLEAGLKIEDLRHLCSAHMEALRDELDAFKASLPSGHVLHTMVVEHDHILGFLESLESIIGKAKKETHLSLEDQKKLQDVADHLVAAEPHHQREEEVLFPELESRGIYGPPQVMRQEHGNFVPGNMS